MSWKNWSDIIKISKNKTIFFYGRSEDWVPKSSKFVSCDYIIDQDTNYLDSYFLDIPIKPPSFLYEFKKDLLVIITNSDFENLKNELISKGIKQDYIFFCPEFRDFQKLIEIRDQEFDILLTSPDFKKGKATRTSKLGGGLFRALKKNNELKIIKIKNGNYRTIRRYDSSYYVINNVDKCLDIFDLKFNHKKKIKLHFASATGLAINNNHIYITSSSSDIIYKLDFNGKILEEINFGDMSSSKNLSRYHINDIELIENDELCVSYFSYSGYWKYGIFDGGASIINLKSKNKSKIYSDLIQPHTPKYINGNIHICDSFNGHLYESTFGLVSSFPGFIRGLDFSNGKFFVGQSETMYMSRKKGLSNNIMCNAGIWILEPESKATKFIDIDGLCNIHSILKV